MTSTVVVEQQTLDQKRKAAQASEDNPRTSHDQVYVYDGADSGYISKEASGSERVAPRTLYKFDKEIPREANERFLDLRDLFADPLFDYAFKSAKKEKHMSWQLKWLGEDENQMKPHIVVACHQKYKKKVKKYFEQAHVKCELQRPDAYIQPAIFVCEGPWILASVLRRNAFLAEPSSNTLCGLAITTSENDVLRQVATLGGIIACKNKDGTSHLWGLTVGHVFHTQEHGSDRSEASDSSEDSDDRTENEADGSDVEISPEILHGRLQAEVPRIRDLNLFKNSLSRENQKTISTSAMIKDPQSSETYRYYDWALVDLANIPNVADQLLNRVTYASELHQITKARNLKLDRETPSKDVAIGSRRVLILAASNDEGLSPLVGVVSLNPSFINLGIGGYPIMVLSLKLLEKSSRSLAKGDCGAWVVDAENYDVYGHVVALDPFGDALIIPIDDMLNDIKETLGFQKVVIHNSEIIRPDVNRMVAQLSSSTPTLLTDDTPHYDTASDLTVPLTLPANAAAPKNSDDQLATNERSKEDYPEERQASGEDEEKHEYPRVSEQYLMTMALCLSVFSISLGHTMISTAIPEITDQFNSLGDIGWYGSAYSLTTGTFLPVFGRLYKVGSVKWIFLFAIFIFELGSLACGLARISRILIFGRALVGLGSAGISSGTLPIISHYVPVRQRFTHTTIMTAASGIAFLVGPLIGGAFTVHISWRWCFFINLPLVGISGFSILFFYPFQQRKAPTAKGLLELLTELPKKMKTNRGSLRLFVHWFMKLERFGLFATFIDIPGIVCLLLALSWGGTTYTWSDWRIILLFVLYAILIMTSIAMQAWRKEYAISPFALGQRSIYAGLGFAFCMSAAFSIINYYMPIWFQAVKGASPTNSGVMSLPLVISVPVLSIMVRSAIMHVGYYMPFMIASSIFMSAGAGLLTTLRPNTGQEAWIGYLVLFGTGVGLGMQLSVIAVQTVLLLTVPSEGEVLIMSARHLGDAIFISIGQNIFENRLVSNLRSMQPDVNAPQIGSFGTTTMRNLFPAESLPKVLTAYNSAINQALYTAVGIAALSTIGSLLMKPTLSRTQLDEMKVTSVDMNEYKVAMRRSRRAEPCDTSRDLSSSRPSLTPLIST